MFFVQICCIRLYANGPLQFDRFRSVFHRPSHPVHALPTSSGHQIFSLGHAYPSWSQTRQYSRQWRLLNKSKDQLCFWSIFALIRLIISCLRQSLYYSAYMPPPIKRLWAYKRGIAKNRFLFFICIWKKIAQ